MNRAAAVVAVVSLGLSVSACKKKQEDGVDRVVTAAPAAEAASPEPRPVTELLTEASRRGRGLPIARMTIDYVGVDGIMDPAYARIEVTFGRAEGVADLKPGDDPNRRTGAPVVKTAPPPKPPECPRVTWRQGQWETRNQACSKEPAMRPSCTVQLIWAKALVQGAPRDAVAKLRYDGTISGSQPVPQWRFDIVDEVRDVRFHKTFPDDCGGMVEAPDATVPQDAPVLATLDRQMITNGMGAVKPSVMACARGDVKGVVKVKINVSPAGTPAVVTVLTTPDPDLGECVAAAIRLARFAKTQNGGSFTFPFMF